MFKSLAAPTVFTSASYENLKHLMSKHKNPKPNPTAERFKFNIRNRAHSETISEYMAELQRLTQCCDYGTVLNDMLRDRLGCGVNHSQIQQKLLRERSSLTLEKAQSIAISVEAAIKQSLLINNHQQLSQKFNELQKSVLKVNSEQKSEKLCYRCDGYHKLEICLFKEKECFYCKTKGHTIKVCR